MYSSDDSDEGETSPSNLYRSPIAGLKPALDSIFAEVQANIPIIGSDTDSELDSDEEPVVFNRIGDLTSLSPSNKDISLSLTEVQKELQIETTPLDDSLDLNDEPEPKVSSTSTDSGFSLHSDIDRSLNNHVFKPSNEVQDEKTPIDCKQTTDSSVQADLDGPSAASNHEGSINSDLQDHVGLSFFRLAHIDFDDLMKRVNEVTVPSWPDIHPLEVDYYNNNETDSDDSDGSDSSDELMKQLVNLSQKQQEQAITVSKSRTLGNTTSTHSPKTDSCIQQPEESKTKEFGAQADGSHHDAGTMVVHSMSSVGVSASFGSLSYNMGMDFHKRDSRPEDRGTIFIDLRNQKIEPRNPEKVTSEYSSSIQRILGMREEDSSSSSSEDDYDMELWHEQRRRIKQALAAKNQTEGSNTVKANPPNNIAKTSKTKTKADDMKTIPGHLHQEKNGKEMKREKHLEIKYSFDEQISAEEGNLKDNDDYDEYVMIKIDDSSPDKTVAEFVPIQSIEHKTVKLSAPECTSNTKYDDSRAKEVNKRIALMLLDNKELEPEIMTGQKEAWAKKEGSGQKRSLPDEKSTKPKEKRAVIEEAVTKRSGSVDTPQRNTGEEVKQKQEDPIKETSSKEKKCKKNSQQKILDEKMRAKKLRIQHRLESVKRERESRTVGGHVCIAAPETPIVFDLDASYEPQPTSLPDNFSSKSYLLLSVPLSTCGELSVGGNKGTSGKGGNRSSQTGVDCHCFNTFLAWLLSMVCVPEHTHYEDCAAFCDAPFHVIGLQQTWHEGELSIKVGICSREEFQGTRTKQGSKGNTFQTAVAKFLRTNTLSNVLTKIVGYSPSFVNMSFGQKNLSSLLTINSDPQAMIRVFGVEPGFYWKTHEVEDTVDTSSSNIEYCGPQVQNTMMLVQFLAHHDPICMYDILNHVWKEGLDMAGIRLVYTHRIPFDERPGLDTSSSNVFQHGSPLLALAIRGPHALSRWLDTVGPKDTWLARRTDPSSLRAVYGAEEKEDHLFYCPRNSDRANTELARWFGGRVPPGDTLNIGSDDVVVQRPRSGSRGRKEERAGTPTSALHTPLPSPPCTLVASTESLVVIVASPLILPRCYGIVLAICSSRGFTLQGIRRIRFHPPNQKDGSRDYLGLTAPQLPIFCPSKSFTSYQTASQVFVFDGQNPDAQTPFSCACTMICLRKENGMHQVSSLVAALTEEIAHMEYLPREITSQGQTAASKLCFAVVPYSQNVGHILGNKIKESQNPNVFAAASLSHSFHSNPELEQVCVLTLLKEKATRYCYEILDQLTLDSPRTFQMNTDDFEKIYCGFELLGIKFVSSMTMHQAKEFTPYEVGDKLWQSSLKPLTSGPALICALRGVNGFERLRHFIHSCYGCSPKKRPLQIKDGMCPDMFMSSTPEIAYRQLTAIFFEHELHADHSMRANQHYLPPIRRDPITNGAINTEASPKQKGKKSGRSNSPARGNAHTSNGSLSPDDVPIIANLLSGPRLLNTVCLIKPDAVPKYVGKVLKRLTREGFSIVNMKMDYLTEGDGLALVLRDWDSLKDEQNCHVKHLTSGPVIILSLQRENAVGKLLDVLGPGNPDECRHESQFYLRGSYGLDRIRNALYGSCSYENAVKDHKLLFAQGVCCSPTIDLKAEGIPCLISDTMFNTGAQRTLVDVLEDSKSTSCSTDSEFSTVYLPPSLLEVNCILLHPNLLKTQGGAGSAVRSTPGFSEVIDGLISAGLQIVGLRMVRLNDSQAAQCTRMYGDSIPADVKQYQMASQLSQGPCVVMAVVRDGAVTSFDTLLGSPLKSNSLATRYGKYILAATSFKKARHLVECFFDHLMPNKKSQIECKVT